MNGIKIVYAIVSVPLLAGLLLFSLVALQHWKQKNAGIVWWTLSLLSVAPWSWALFQVSYNSIFENALKRPYTQILINAGVAQNEQEALFIGNTVGLSEDGKFSVYDALKREAVEFWDSGIFDGAKTVTQALENALSVAQLLMTTGGAVALSVSEDENSIKAMQKGILQAMNNGEVE